MMGARTEPPGLLAVLANDRDGTLGRIWQPVPRVGWSRWEPTMIRLAGPPVVARSSSGALEVFAIGADGHLGHCRQLDPFDMREFSSWATLGPELRCDPVVATKADGLLEVFAIGADGTLGHLWQTDGEGLGEWSRWESLGPRIEGRPAVGDNAHGGLELFAVGSDGCLGHMWQLNDDDVVSGWSGWSSFGYAIRTPPTVVTNARGRSELFAVDDDGYLRHMWQFADSSGRLQWSEWARFGGALTDTPLVVANAGGLLELLAIGPDGCVGHMWQQWDHGGGMYWSKWESFDHRVRSPLAGALDADRCLSVFAVSANGLLGQIWQREPSGARSGWSRWSDLGPPLAEGRPAVSAWGPAPTYIPPDPPALAARLRETVPRPARLLATRRPHLTADVCVIGAGPAGITVAEQLQHAGASVVLAESGDWDADDDAQALNIADATGPIVKDYLTYLSEGRVRRVAGATNAWGGWCMPLRSIDYEPRPWVSGSGWPLSPAELAPYEQRAAATLAVEPFPPPRPDGPLLRLTYRIQSDRTLFARRLTGLLESPDVELEVRATAIELRARGDRIDSVRFVRGTGEELIVSADKVVLAAGGIENARLLLLNERALAGGAGLAGHYFMEHPHVLAGTIVLPDPSGIASYLERPTGTYDVLSLADGAQREDRLLNASVELRARASGEQAPGSPVECDVVVRAEQAPNPDSRVELAERLDSLGCRQARLHWRLLPEDWESVARTAELVAFMLEKRFAAMPRLTIGAQEPWPLAPADPSTKLDPTWGNHHMGTTRMADDPAAGVVDRNCRVHGTSNLYVAGSSVFPTGGAANPTFMLVALAHRLADHLSGVPAGSAEQPVHQLGGPPARGAPIAIGDALEPVEPPNGGEPRVGSPDQHLS